jgi:Asp-tRNA(Asn)/Glu-tRNA(Gln) amidotransferase A subunit family amidase
MTHTTSAPTAGTSAQSPAPTSSHTKSGTGTTAEPVDSFRDASRRFATGRETPRDYLERCLAVIDEREPTVRAWAALNIPGARDAADRSTERWRERRPLSLIDGIPIGIKDLLETHDMPTQMGCKAFAGNHPRRDNAAVRALREAGAVIVGKTVTAELGGTHPGPTTHPLDPTRTPGGSSSGSAAAVGAGMVPATIGTQVAGSIIRPASYCGNWALKPSQGAINRGERQATSMSTHGVHASTCDDMWHVAIAIANRAGGDPGAQRLHGPERAPLKRRPQTVAFMETEGWHTIDAGTLIALDQVLNYLTTAVGVPVQRRHTNSALDHFEQAIVGLRDVALDITAWENHWALAERLPQDPDGFSDRAKANLAHAESLGVDGYQDRLRYRRTVRAAYDEVMNEAEVIISLASPGPAPHWQGDTPGEPLAEWPTGDPVFNAPSSLLGTPVVTVPLLTIHGLPVGLQVMGRRGSDADVTAIARWLASTVPHVNVD